MENTVHLAERVFLCRIFVITMYHIIRANERRERERGYKGDRRETGEWLERERQWNKEKD